MPKRGQHEHTTGDLVRAGQEVVAKDGVDHELWKRLTEGAPR